MILTPLFRSAIRLVAGLALLSSGLTLRADPQLTSWFTANSGQ